MIDSATEPTELLGCLDDKVKAPDLAGQAAYSPAQFYRLVRKSLSGSPMAIRRRLLLERSAYELTRTAKPITAIAFDAAFGSHEGFARAFRRAYHVAPSEYRRLCPTEYRLGTCERLHFAPSPGPQQGVTAMQTAELMIEHHVWHMDSILNAVNDWNDADLDRRMRASEPAVWCESKTTFRKMLSACSTFGAPWMHSINGIETPYEVNAVPEMREEIKRSRIGFLEIIRSVERDRSWDLTFVDAVCEPPEVFSYGGVIGHVITFNAYRRFALVCELRELGHPELRFSCPIEYPGGAGDLPSAERTAT